MIKGMTIILVEQTANGVDEFNRPKYTETEVSVENVLVGLPETSGITASNDLTGKKGSYVLGIPKGDTHEWKDRKVKFFGRTWKTFGYPIEGIETNIPLSWHKKVMVEAYE